MQNSSEIGLLYKDIKEENYAHSYDRKESGSAFVDHDEFLSAWQIFNYYC